MIKNKKIFIYFITFLIFSIIFIGFIISIFFKGVDRNAYLELIYGEGYINEKALVIGDRVKILENDIIETKTTESLAIIEWGDGSITRLGGNSRMQIREQFVSKNKDKVNIVFNLLSGKTWSNVVSYLGEDSYFKQNFSDTEAAVRGTIFSVDLEKDYVHVEKHKVDLKSESKGEIEVLENKQLQITNFKFISFEDFIKFFKDKNFFNLNIELDKKFFLERITDLKNNFEDLKNYSYEKFDNLTKEQREKAYKELLSKYQEINFVSLDHSKELFSLKIALKEKLISLTPDSGKEQILNTLSYDLQDMFKNKNFENFEKITSILKTNQEYIDFKKFFSNFNINFDFQEILNKGTDILSNFESEVLKSKIFIEWSNLGGKFIQGLGDESLKAIETQKGVFLEMWNFIKKIFN